MGIKELLKLDASGLEKLTDAQLKEYFAPYLKAIVPEQKKEQTPSGPRPKGKNEAQRTLEMAKKMAERLGIKLD